MNNNEEKISWDAIAARLSMDPNRSTEQLKAELHADGLDVDVFLQRGQKAIRNKLQQIWKKAAEEERRKDEISTADVLRDVASWSKSKLEEWLTDAQAGRLGERIQAMAEPCYCNKQAKPMTEAEIKIFVADILRLMEKLKK